MATSMWPRVDLEQGQVSCAAEARRLDGGTLRIGHADVGQDTRNAGRGHHSDNRRRRPVYQHRRPLRRPVRDEFLMGSAATSRGGWIWGSTLSSSRRGETVGVTKKVAAEIVRDLRNQLSRDGRSVNVKAVRLIAATRTTTESGAFQVVAKAFFEAAADRDSPPRPEALNSVVTAGRTGGVQRLEGVSVPALSRAIA